MRDAGNGIGGDTFVQSTVIRSDMRDIEMAYNIPRHVHKLANGIAMQGGHVDNRLGVQQPCELNAECELNHQVMRRRESKG